MKLSSIAGGVVDPRKEGYPAFCLFGGDMNTYSQVKVIGSDLQNIGSPWAAGCNTTMSYGHGMLADPMFSYSHADAGTPNANLSTQGYSSWTTWVQSLHQSDQYPMSMYGSTSALGYQSFNNFVSDTSYNNTKMTRGYTLINQVMPEGIRPRRFFGMQGNTFQEYVALTQMTNPLDTFALNTKQISRTASYVTGNGSAGYNERINTLVTLHSTGSTASVIATKFVNPNVNLNTCASLKEFFDTAAVTEYTLTMTPFGSDSYSDKVVVVGDNGWIGVSYRESTNMYATAYDLTGGNASAINFSTQGMTTSYGVSQGVYYYTKMNTTWDGQWAMAYTPYYYYGCGCFGYIFSTQDPRRAFRINNQYTSGGGMLVPYGKSGFRYMVGENTDSAPVYLISWDMKFTDPLYSAGAATVYAHSNASGQQTIANDGLFNSSVNPYSGITGFFYSTCYPNFQTVNYWPLNGKNTYEGGTL